VNLFTGAGIFLLGSKLWRREVGVLAAALWLVVLPFYLGNYLLLEPFATALCVWSAVAALWTVSSERLQRSRLVQVLQPLGLAALLAGMILALGSMFRQTAVLELPAIIVLLWARASAWRERLRAALLMVAGFCLPWLIVCACFAIVGGLGPLINDVVWANLLHYPGDSRSLVLQEAQVFFGYAPLVWLVPIGALLVVVIQALARRRLPSAGVVACYLSGVLGWIPILSHHYVHYWLQPLPWACLLTALAACWVGERTLELMSQRRAVLRPTEYTVALVALMGAFCAVVATSPIGTRQQVDSSQFASQIGEAAWLNSLVPAKATLMVGPAEPEFYFLTGRPAQASYVYLLPVDRALYVQAAADVRAGRYEYIAWVTSDPALQQYAQITEQIQLRYHQVGFFRGSLGAGGSDCALYALDLPAS
jgi:hypothetical protein